MILLNALVGLFSIFIAPQIILYYKYPSVRYSLMLLYGFIISLSGVWIIFLLNFYLHLSDIIFTIFAYLITGYTLFLFLKSHIEQKNFSVTFNFIIAILILLPLLSNIGSGFFSLDAASSWNRWAIELYNNIYKPIDAAYPILLPALWSVIYKIQETNDIWWTAQITLFIIPVFILGLLFTLYKEEKDSSYLWMAFLVYPYLLLPSIINGNMDMPVMFMGLLSLIALYTAERNKGKKEFEYYTFVSLLLAGLASVTKQAGIAFILFNFLYIALNFKYYSYKKYLLIGTLFSISYFLSFLILYYSHNYASAIHNINHLKHLSHKINSRNSLYEYIQILYERYWPIYVYKNIPLLESLVSLFKIKIITPILLLIAYLSFCFKKLRQFNSVNFLSSLFFLIGVTLWAKYFSYDFRNSLWTRAFFIIFVSVNINYLINRYKNSIYLFKAVVMLIILGIFGYAFLLGDGYTYEKQKEGQIKVGQNEGLAKEIAKLLKNKKSCCKVYTNELAIPYNYYLKKYQKRGQFEAIGRDYKFQNFSYLEHNCSDGRYMVLRKTTMYMDEWWKIKRLLSLGLIKEIEPLIYYIPPDISIPKDYFINRYGAILQKNFKINAKAEDIAFYIEYLKNQKNLLSISGWAFVKNISNEKLKKYLIIKNSEYSYVYLLHNLHRNDVANYFKDKKYINSGFKGVINIKNLTKGVYNIYILIIDNRGIQHIAKTKKSIKIK